MVTYAINGRGGISCGLLESIVGFNEAHFTHCLKLCYQRCKSIEVVSIMKERSAAQLTVTAVGMEVDLHNN